MSSSEPREGVATQSPLSRHRVADLMTLSAITARADECDDTSELISISELEQSSGSEEVAGRLGARNHEEHPVDCLLERSVEISFLG